MKCRLCDHEAIPGKVYCRRHIQSFIRFIFRNWTRRLYLELVAYVATGSFFSNKKSKKPLEPISIDEIISEAARSLLEYTDRHDIRYDDKFALFINIARSSKYSDKVLKECYYKVLGYTTTITFKND